MHQIIPLELLSPGEAGRVIEVDGQQALVCRLAEMGLREGADVTMIKPGQPCIVALGNHRLSFRGEDAAVVMVEVGG